MLPRVLLPASWLILACVVVGGCGGGDEGAADEKLSSSSSAVEVPADAVAVVGDVPIPKERFVRWFNAVAAPTADMRPDQHRIMRSAAGGYPKFATCIAKRVRLGAPRAAARADCELAFNSIVPHVVPTLIQLEWIRQEARLRGVSATAAEVRRAVAQLVREDRAARDRQQPAPGEMAAEDMRLRAEGLVLQEKLEAGASRPTETEMREYWEENKAALPFAPGEEPFSPAGKRRIRAAMRAEREQTGASAHVVPMGERLRPKTVCREGYVVPLCGDTDKD